MVIDYTQFAAWNDRCPWYWAERYGRGIVVTHDEGRMRDDAAAIGSLVHGGLETLYRDGRIEIPDPTIAEIDPTPEALAEAMRLVQGYAEVYMGDTWQTQEIEKTITWLITPEMGNTMAPAPNEAIYGAAKLDRCMKLAQDTPLATGLGDVEIMQAGWWGQEYKTGGVQKQHQRATWIKQWVVNMQATTQIRALQEHVRSIGEDPRTVRGVLVTKIERAGEYVPKRTCKNKECKQVLEMAAYLPSGDGKYACPVCGYVQELSPVKETMKVRMPTYYRVVATRTPEQLARQLREFEQVARQMAYMKHAYGDGNGGMGVEYQAVMPPRRAACCDSWWGKTCPYFEAHANYVDLIELPDFEVQNTTRYMGLASGTERGQYDVYTQQNT